MRNRLIKLLIVISLVIACITPAFAVTEVDLGGVKPGSMDTSYKGIENEVKQGNITEEFLYQLMLTEGFSPNIVAKILDDGYATQYAEELKQNKLLPEDYSIEKINKKKSPFSVKKMNSSMYICGENKVEIYSGADYTYEILMYLIRGTKVSVTGYTSTDWYEIQINDNVGYVQKDNLTETNTDLVSVSEDTISYIESDPESEPLILPATHTFPCIDEESLEALTKFSASGIEGESYINVLCSSEDNVIPGNILELSSINKSDLTVRYIELLHLMVKSSVAQNKTNRDTIQLDFLQRARKVA